MNIGSRIAAWFGGKKLPYEAEVEWLQLAKDLTVDYYINTGILFTGHKVRMGFRVGDVFAWSNGNIYPVRGGINRSSNFRDCGCWVSNNSERLQSGLATVDPSDYVSRCYGHDFVIETQIPDIADKRFSDLSDIIIFGYSYVEWDLKKDYRYTNFRGGAKIYFFQVLDESGKLVMDMIPVRKDGVGYMYDKVNGMLFANDGTGAFIIGPDKASNGGGINA